MATQYAFGKIVTDGLVLCLDAADRNSYVSGSTTWFDVAGSNNGTLTNEPTFNTGSGGSIVFDGVDDYVGRNTALDVGSNFSAFAWVRPGSINVRNAIIGNSYPYQSGVGWFLATATNYSGVTNTFFISIGNDSAYQTAANNSIVLNTWNYIGGTVINGGQNIKLYVNGIETAYLPSNLSANTVVYTSPELNIGRRASSNPEPWIGNIASTQIYNRVLSASEILQNYNAQKSRFGL